MAEADVFKKDWITMLVSTSGILLALVGAVVGVYHSALNEFYGPVVVVDALALLAMVCFVLAMFRGLKALGTLVIATPSSKDQKILADKAKAAQFWFLFGVCFTVLTAATAMIVVNFGQA